MEAIDMIKNRRSVRRYEDRLVPKDVLQDILDCGRLAPTAGNGQQWLFGCVTDKAQLEKLGNTTLYAKFIKSSPACFAVFCHKDHMLPVDDGCAATMNLIYGAAAHGLGTCWVWGNGAPYADEARKVLGVPEDYKLIALVPGGYPAEKPHPQKKALAEISFWDRYQ